MQIVGQDIILQRWKLDDAARLTEIADNERISQNLSDGFPSPYTSEDAKNYITNANNQEKNLLLAIYFKDTIVGSIALMFQADIYRKSAIIAYFVAEEFWGRGIASKAIQLITDYAFLNFDIVRISAEPFERNIGSIKALEKAGFHYEGTLRKNVCKQGESINSCLYAKINEAFNQQGI